MLHAVFHFSLVAWVSLSSLSGLPLQSMSRSTTPLSRATSKKNAQRSQEPRRLAMVGIDPMDKSLYVVHDSRVPSSWKSGIDPWAFGSLPGLGTKKSDSKLIFRHSEHSLMSVDIWLVREKDKGDRNLMKECARK